MFEQSLFFTILVGSSAGFTYGLFFGHTQKRALLLTTNTPLNSFLLFLASSAARLALFALCGFYLLRLAKIHFILLTIAFIITFWTAIFNTKA